MSTKTTEIHKAITCYAGDPHGGPVALEATSLADAIDEVESNWPETYEPVDETSWVNIRVWAENADGEVVGDYENICLTINPTEPACTVDEHDWQSPHEIVGGIKENPGVWGSGGGVKIHEVCAHCGTHRHTDTWATDMSNGTQGHTSVSYDDPTEESLAWIARLRA